MRAIPDSGPIIHLSWIEHLHLLDALFDDVMVAPAVHREVLAASSETRGLDAIQRFLSSMSVRVQAPTLPRDPIRALPPSLDEGETESIYLAEAIDDGIFVTDDAAARSIAKRRGLAVTGTVGLLVTARTEGLIPTVLPLALELRRLGQWLDDALIAEIERQERD